MRDKLEKLFNQTLPTEDRIPKTWFNDRAIFTEPFKDDSGGLHVLHKAAQHGYLDMIQATLEYHPDLLNQRDKFNQTPLIWASCHGHQAIVEYLIELRCDLNCATNCPGDDVRHNHTALHWAADNKHWAIVRLLVQAGAVIDKETLQNAHFRTYLYRDKDLDVVRVLAKDRTLLTILDEVSILHKIAQHGCLDMMKIILEQNPDLLNQRDAFNQTPLIWAVSSGHQEVVEYLVSLGADLHVTTDCPSNDLEHGRTALDWAVAEGHSDICTMLEMASNNSVKHAQTSVTNVSFLRTKKLDILPNDFEWVNVFGKTP